MDSRSLQLYIFIVVFNCIGQVQAQVNIMGKPGYINTPSACWIENRPVGISFAHIPGPYSLFRSELTNANFYNLRAEFTSFLEVNFSVGHRPARAEAKNLGIGDRHLDFRIRFLKENKNYPSIVLGFTPPGSASPLLNHHYIVLTKNIKTGMGLFSITSGYGSPYIFRKNQNATWFLDLELIKKEEFANSNYLSGLFAGIAYMPVPFGGVMIEHDSNTVNAGAFIKPWDWLVLQISNYEGKEWGGSMAVSISLDHKAKRIR